MGSSAVPVKEKQSRVSVYHHCQLVRSQVALSFENIPLWHERDLSNSANERFVIPTVSILVDEMLETMTKITSNLTVK